MQNTDKEWQDFLMGIKTEHKGVETVFKSDEMAITEELYISTKTKVLYLNQGIDIHRIFWEIPILEYGTPSEGVIKKQMKIVSKSVEEFETYQKRLEHIPYYTDLIIKQINNPNARKIKFKDERKLTVGVSKKDIMNCRGKQKNAFYNCFAMVLRFYCGEYKEIHVKVFNTGKLEIPGILNNRLLDTVKRMILEVVQPHVTAPLEYTYTDRADENVLINSNFNCGFYINREKIHAILRSDKYGIKSAFDPCSYPGVKCKYYFNNELDYDHQIQRGQVSTADRALKMCEIDDAQKYTEVSFMIFRTGSVLIVGNCSEKCLLFVFEFIKHMLEEEYINIRIENDEPSTRVKKRKLRKKTIQVTSQYFQEAVHLGV
jgi:hypothetical protein|uniref:Uncharacterized protein n=1 Tax=viral metagenome TaxID=1070528 RepID=A0A6C0DWT3_9ZZZZ